MISKLDSLNPNNLRCECIFRACVSNKSERLSAEKNFNY